MRIPSWLQDLLRFGESPERDYVAGIFDGDPDRPRRPLGARPPRTMQITVYLEFEPGKETVLTTCRVTEVELRRFFADAETNRAIRQNATVYLYPAAINSVPQMRVGVPIDRLARIRRADGSDIWSRGAALDSQDAE